ncbi:hypothetical protein ASD01_18670 [Ensifer sp. Root423]|nr:hypothetical protein ASD01_18670 [Ensifer sp. Root423]
MEGHSYKGVSNGRINAAKLLRRAAAKRRQGDQGNDQGGQQGGRSVKIEVARVLLFREFPT